MAYIKSEIHELPANIDELFRTGEATYYIKEHHRKVKAAEAMQYFLECLSGYDETYLDWNDRTTVYLTHPKFSYYLVVFAKSLKGGRSHAFEVSVAKKNEKGEFIKYQRIIKGPKEIENTREY